MAKYTIQERLQAALEARGERVITTAKTRKYVVMTRSDKSGKFFYLGKSGALRTGHTVQSSIPVDHFKATLLSEFDDA